TGAALLQCARMRQGSVRMPLSTNQESKGEGTAPPTTCTERRRSASGPASRVTTTPPITSQWPERYLVVECITRSTPRARGRCKKGVAQVLSQAVRTPADFAIATTAFKSVTAIVGFEGVSVQMRRVLGRRAARRADRSVMSANDTSRPHGLKWSRSSFEVPKEASGG